MFRLAPFLIVFMLQMQLFAAQSEQQTQATLVPIESTLQFIKNNQKIKAMTCTGQKCFAIGQSSGYTQEEWRSILNICKTQGTVEFIANTVNFLAGVATFYMFGVEGMVINYFSPRPRSMRPGDDYPVSTNDMRETAGIYGNGLPIEGMYPIKQELLISTRNSLIACTQIFETERAALLPNCRNPIFSSCTAESDAI